MSAILYRLGRWCAEHGWRVLVVWLLIVVAAAGLNRFGSPMPERYDLPATDGAIATDLVYRAFPGAAAEANPLVLHNPGLDFRTGEGARVVANVAAAERQVEHVSEVVAPADRPELVSADGHTAQVLVTVVAEYAADAAVGKDILTAAQEAAGPSVTVAIGGFLGRALSQPASRTSEALGLAAAVVVLFITLRRPLGVMIPLVNALIAVGLGLSLVGLLGKLTFIPDVAPTLGTMLGLGVGIDYALFLVIRHRMLMRQGYDVSDSVGRTAGTAGAAMVFAGGTLIAAMAGLVFTGLSFLAWLGFAAAVVVAIAVIASVTLVPALLGLTGQRIVPKKEREVAHSSESLDSSRWARMATFVTSRPWTFAITSVAVLLLMAAPTLTLSLGHSDAGTLPATTTARQAEDLLRAGFGPGTSSPLLVVSRLYAPATAPDKADAPEPDQPAATTKGRDPRAADPRLTELTDALRATPGVVKVFDPVVSTDGGVATIRVTPQWSSADPRTEALVQSLRASVLPDLDAASGMSSHVGGITALNIDIAELIAQRTPWFIAGVVSLAFLLLMLAYRSVVIPIKAAAMNLLSIAAAYGVITVVFQWGWGATFIGLPGPVPIDSFVPMMIFAVLFGLSMDYEVFLLTAFREQWELTGDMKVAVRRGLADTGRVVTAAALIMVVVFSSFILDTDPTVKIFGVGLATAVAVDATIVRCLLVPAIMVLAAKGTWWLPGWLDRLLPQVHIEGDPAAIDAVSRVRVKSGPSESSPMVVRTPLAALGMFVGAVLAFVGVGAATDWLNPAVIAVSSVAGAAAAIVPLGRRRVSLTRRLAGLALGALAALAASALVLSALPVRSDSGTVVVTVALLVIALLCVMVLPRQMALPALLGAVAVAVGVISLDAPELMPLGLVTVVPALAASVIAGAIAALATQRPAVSEAPGSSDEQSAAERTEVVT